MISDEVSEQKAWKKGSFSVCISLFSHVKSKYYIYYKLNNTEVYWKA